MFEKVKAFFGELGKKGKVLMASCVAMVSAVSMAAIASAEEAVSETVPEAGATMESMLADAGSQLTTQFSSLVTTIIPVVLGILGSGLVIFGIFALVKLAKKIFNKVAG